MLTPRNAKEFAKLLGNDPELRRKIHGLIARVDDMIENEALAAIKQSVRRNQISLQLLSHDDATRGLKRYYADIKASGNFVKMW